MYGCKNHGVDIRENHDQRDQKKRTPDVVRPLSLGRLGINRDLIPIHFLYFIIYFFDSFFEGYFCFPALCI